MARQKVEQIQCDRCKRVELQAALPEPKSEPTFTCRLGAETLTYEDLCSFCQESLKRHFDEMGQWDRELSQRMLGVMPGPAVSGNAAAPGVSAPDYSPPKPHSAAAAKK